MYIHTRGHLVLQCFGWLEFTRFKETKTKRLRRLFQYVLYITHPEDISPQRGLNTAKLLFCAAKILHFFYIRKENVCFYAFLRIFWNFRSKKKRKTPPGGDGVICKNLQNYQKLIIRNNIYSNISLSSWRVSSFSWFKSFMSSSAAPDASCSKPFNNPAPPDSWPFA